MGIVIAIDTHVYYIIIYNNKSRQTASIVLVKINDFAKKSLDTLTIDKNRKKKKPLSTNVERGFMSHKQSNNRNRDNA